MPESTDYTAISEDQFSALTDAEQESALLDLQNRKDALREQIKGLRALRDVRVAEAGLQEKIRGMSPAELAALKKLKKGAIDAIVEAEPLDGGKVAPGEE